MKTILNHFFVANCEKQAFYQLEIDSHNKCIGTLSKNFSVSVINLEG